MPEFTINTLDDYLRHVPSSAALECRLAFRGQEADYPLIPSLFRSGHACIGRQDNWDSYEQTIVRLFKREAIAALDREPKNYSDWIVLAQHHGVPTRVLDWSQSPIIALYFAVESLSDADGIVWSYSANRFQLLPFETPNELNGMNEVYIFMPRHEDARMTAQSGCMTFHPLPGDTQPFTPFGPSSTSDSNWSKFVIPSGLKETLLFQLDDLGINAHSIYPDLDGLAREIKQRIYRFQRQGEADAQVRYRQRLV